MPVRAYRFCCDGIACVELQQRQRTVAFLRTHVCVVLTLKVVNQLLILRLQGSWNSLITHLRALSQSMMKTPAPQALHSCECELVHAGPLSSPVPMHSRACACARPCAVLYLCIPVPVPVPAPVQCCTCPCACGILCTCTHRAPVPSHTKHVLHAMGSCHHTSCVHKWLLCRIFRAPVHGRVHTQGP